MSIMPQLRSPAREKATLLGKIGAGPDEWTLLPSRVSCDCLGTLQHLPSVRRFEPKPLDTHTKPSFCDLACPSASLSKTRIATMSLVNACYIDGEIWLFKFGHWKQGHLLFLKSASWRRQGSKTYSHLTDKDAEAQGGKGTIPKLPSTASSPPFLQVSQDKVNHFH